jgi:tRNA(Met) C34 N-acetyltransferase TmcA
MLLLAIRKAIALMCVGVGFGLTYITIREWVRNGFDLLPRDKDSFTGETFTDKENK